MKNLKCESCDSVADVDIKIVYEDKTEAYHKVCRNCGFQHAEHIYLELGQEDAEFWVKPFNTRVWITVKEDSLEFIEEAENTLDEMEV